MEPYTFIHPAKILFTLGILYGPLWEALVKMVGVGVILVKYEQIKLRLKALCVIEII